MIFAVLRCLSYALWFVNCSRRTGVAINCFARCCNRRLRHWFRRLSDSFLITMTDVYGNSVGFHRRVPYKTSKFTALITTRRVIVIYRNYLHWVWAGCRRSRQSIVNSSAILSLSHVKCDPICVLTWSMSHCDNATSSTRRPITRLSVCFPISLRKRWASSYVTLLNSGSLWCWINTIMHVIILTRTEHTSTKANLVRIRRYAETGSGLWIVKKMKT